MLPPHQFGLFARDHCRNGLRLHGEARNGIQELHTAAGDGTHGVFLVAGHTELANHNDVQRRP